MYQYNSADKYYAVVTVTIKRRLLKIKDHNPKLVGTNPTLFEGWRNLTEAQQSGNAPRLDQRSTQRPFVSGCDPQITKMHLISTKSKGKPSTVYKLFNLLVK